MNMRIHGWWPSYGATYPMHKTSYLKKPSSAISIADNKVEYNFILYRSEFMMERHPNKRANFLYLDGHVVGCNMGQVIANGGGSTSNSGILWTH
jgi:prepilin-type processing-associated H-X9-DG protein